MSYASHTYLLVHNPYVSSTKAKNRLSRRKKNRFLVLRSDNINLHRLTIFFCILWEGIGAEMESSYEFLSAVIAVIQTSLLILNDAEAKLVDECSSCLFCQQVKKHER